ncbi:CAP domain-containing protein [Anaerobacillus sp. MEB173]|uniref:CAP domain-containing protein n=1 Tax=Anaerobacillus sp. MEB173 TaxID=3383345 RepID=UPI003F924D27
MRKEIIVLFITGFLLLFIAACNGNNNAAMDNGNFGLNAQGNQYNQGQQRQEEVVIDEESGKPYGSTISSYRTKLTSQTYPHTKPVQIQQAKYYFKLDQIPEGVKQQLPKEIANQLQNAEQLSIEQLERYLSTEQIQQMVPDTAPAPQQGAAPQPAAPQQPATQAPAQEPKQEQAKQPQQSAEGISSIEQKVIELTNAERRKAGLSNLQADAALSNVAREKSRDMQANNYFSHTSPTYGSPFDMIRDAGVSYNAAAENIAMGQSTAEQVVQEWMNSEGHRRNILSGEYTHIGVGYNEKGHYWTQMFISK